METQETTNTTNDNAINTQKELVVIIRRDGFELDWQETESPTEGRQFSAQRRLFEEWREISWTWHPS